MDSKVISQHFLDLVGDRKCIAAVFTTFTFEPDFFELEVIPLLLDQTQAYSADDRVKRLMVREHLREEALPIDVYYDQPMFRVNGAASPEMEYGCHGVLHPNGAFHGKVCLILVEDVDNRQRSLLLGAGSNNLTRAGWWDNIECQHWVELAPRAYGVKLRNILLEDIELLREHRDPGFTRSDATDAVREYLQETRCAQSADPIHYFGLSIPKKRRGFLNFLFSDARRLGGRGGWQLEIISPFFADNPLNKEHDAFLSQGVTSITILLPRDEEGAALCPEAYYMAVQAEPALQWGKWTDELQKSLGMAGGYHRCLHAKIYHFYRGHESWVFVGSVNFTHKALYDNIEAGFLVKLDKRQRFLEPLPDDVRIPDFREPEEIEPGAELDQHDEAGIPTCQFCYDWLKGELTGRVGDDEQVRLQLYGPTGEFVIEPWTVTGEMGLYQKDNSKLQAALGHGALLEVSGHWLEGTFKGRGFPRHRVLVQQQGWSHKPLDLPDLTPAQILAIYAGMSPDRRQLLLASEKIRQLLLRHQGVELGSMPDEAVAKQFFSEYAEIFNAFRMLRRRMVRALDEGRTAELDYYLTGTGIDSLPTLVNKAVGVDKDQNENNDNDKELLSGVSAYLLLLCVEEIFCHKPFARRSNVGQHRERVVEERERLECGGRIRLDQFTGAQRAGFFRWFREQFFREYQPVEDETP